MRVRIKIDMYLFKSLVSDYHRTISPRVRGVSILRLRWVGCLVRLPVFMMDSYTTSLPYLQSLPEPRLTSSPQTSNRVVERTEFTRSLILVGLRVSSTLSHLIWIALFVYLDLPRSPPGNTCNNYGTGLEDLGEGVRPRTKITGGRCLWNPLPSRGVERDLLKGTYRLQRHRSLRTLITIGE